jgi:hypothetical protein
VVGGDEVTADPQGVEQQAADFNVVLVVGEGAKERAQVVLPPVVDALEARRDPTVAPSPVAHGAYPLPEARVSVFPLEVPDGTWGAIGGIIRLPDIYELAWPPRPDTEGEPRETAARVLAERRRDAAEAVLAAARESLAP